MTQRWKVRIYQDGDEKGIVNLMNRVFPHSNYDIRRWLWEYKNNPCGYLAAVATFDGQIVGHMGLVPVNMKVGNHILKGGQAVDLAVHPNFRRQGMSLKLGENLMKNATEKGVSISYGFPNEASYSSMRKYGWFEVTEVPFLIKFLNKSIVLKSLLPRLYFFLRQSGKSFLHFSRYTLSWYANFLLSIRRDRRSRMQISENLQIRTVSFFDDRINDLWNTVSKDYAILVVRNAEYLNWRYVKKPNGNYEVFLAEKDDTIRGYVILTTWMTRYQKVGYIVDIFANSKNTMQHLIHTAIEYFNDKKVDLISSWTMKGSPYYMVLTENGFVHNYFPKGIRLIARVNLRKLLELYKNTQENWYVTMGDSDGI